MIWRGVSLGARGGGGRGVVEGGIGTHFFGVEVVDVDARHVLG